MNDSTTLRCLSIRNPWAWAICLGEKEVENRTWTTSFRGTIAIQASASKDTVRRALKSDPDGVVRPEFFTFGAIIGLADLVDVVEYGPQFEDDPWACGPYCWKLENGRFIESPIPLKGKLQLFELTSDVTEQVWRQATYRPDAGDPPIPQLLELVRPALEPVSHYLFAAQHHLEKGNLRSVSWACENCLRLDPDSAVAHFFKGRVAEFEGDDDLAVECFTAALSADPEFIDAHVCRGDILFDQGELDRAWKDYTAASEQDPDWALPHVGCAAVLNARAEFEQALARICKAIELLPDEPVCYLRQAEAFLGLGQAQDAIASATEALNKDQQMVEALEVRSEAYSAADEPELAKQDRRAAEMIYAEAEEI